MKRYIILCLFLASNAYSYTQQHALVEKLGVQGDSIYFSISLPLLTNCQWNNIYFNNTSMRISWRQNPPIKNYHESIIAKP